MKFYLLHKPTTLRSMFVALSAAAGSMSKQSLVLLFMMLFGLPYLFEAYILPEWGIRPDAGKAFGSGHDTLQFVKYTAAWVSVVGFPITLALHIAVMRPFILMLDKMHRARWNAHPEDKLILQDFSYQIDR
ncbi:hypothetical protein [Ferrimonas marina]|uniref:Uncharacterized protein n=1 Tax=Ferrimonas marina TaxID=299255 RepID=A0A1M5TJU9_9GAMM|nr:hypothetical protein [Ferrimonas marina]SHH50984.1 hypothetical protein SAMN02745129_2173 [Ferrimonas marina]